MDTCSAGRPVNRRSAHGLLLLGLSASACADPPQSEPPLAEARAVARALLTADDGNCFADVPGACLTDPVLVDSILDEGVAQHFGGEFPQRQRDVERLVERVDTAYRVRQLDTPERRETVRQQLAEVYRSPPVKTVDGVVIGDLGVVPCPIVQRGRSGWTVASMAPHVVQQQWSGTEAGTALARLLESHPQARAVEVQIRVPVEGALQRYRLRWLPDRRQVVVHAPGAVDRTHVTPPLAGLAVVRSGQQSLHTSDLHVCVLDSFRTDPLCPAP